MFYFYFIKQYLTLIYHAIKWLCFCNYIDDVDVQNDATYNVTDTIVDCAKSCWLPSIYQHTTWSAWLLLLPTHSSNVVNLDSGDDELFLKNHHRPMCCSDIVPQTVTVLWGTSPRSFCPSTALSDVPPYWTLECCVGSWKAVLELVKQIYIIPLTCQWWLSFLKFAVVYACRIQNGLLHVCLGEYSDL